MSKKITMNLREYETLLQLEKKHTEIENKYYKKYNKWLNEYDENHRFDRDSTILFMGIAVFIETLFIIFK